MAVTQRVGQIPRMTRRGDRSVGAIAIRLRQLMEAMRLPPAAFARHVGWSPQALNNYLSGTNRLSLDAAFKLRTATGVSLDWIYEGDRAGLPFSLAQSLPPETGEKSARSTSAN